MPYFLFNKKPIFLSYHKNIILRDQALKHKDPEFRIASHIHGSKESIEAKILIDNYIKEQYTKDQNEFFKDWFFFDMKDEEARENTWDLLCDYCHYIRHLYMMNLSTPLGRLIRGYQYEFCCYPEGKLYALVHYSKKNIFEGFFTTTKGGNYIKIFVDTNLITNIIGTLDNFYIISKDMILNCHHNLEIIPQSLFDAKVLDKEMFIN